jgi:hypothetical protein
LYVPRTTETSSSLRTATAFTLYFALSSDESGADMSLCRTLDGAVKCALRLFRLEDETLALNFIAGLRALAGAHDA